MTGRHRTARLNQLFRREIARLLQGELKDPRVRGVIVAAVRTTPDLSYATVYVRSGEGTPVEEAVEGMERAGGFIRRELGRSLHLRKVPEFRFEADRTLEQAGRIEELLREAREGEGEQQGEGREPERE